MITIPERYTQTDGQTDRRTTYDLNTALCTKVHRAVKTTEFSLSGTTAWHDARGFCMSAPRHSYHIVYTTLQCLYLLIIIIVKLRYICTPLLKYSCSKSMLCCAYRYHSYMYVTMEEPSRTTILPMRCAQCADIIAVTVV